ncbi:hypothetical protein K458DRAFT_317996 [Lentithecium fluviatile CBS 122367]|uniref:Uncharacterized protein n=1 Tax=Lentithecium fluviatile CBS 122367 TaxID=1168545 RepID=A0A6G1IIW8_9PLEO|nr:hypothetical protein K458DRAFT_317996 [Lentithecium fluviatile CBS 122367]
MAPLDPDTTAQSNLKAVALFGVQVLLVVGLTTKVLLTARRVARSLPPSTETRGQEPIRRRHAITFSVLAFLSLASVTTFAVLWRAMSYLEWAEQGNHETPGSLWTGWYGTGDEGVGRWRLGDWLSDKNLVHESDTIAVSQAETFLYTSQHFVGLLTNSMFMGVEGRRRNLSTSVIASFIVLSAMGSLAYSLCLFFITILYTPLTLHNDETPRQDALFTPKPVVLYVPMILSLLTLSGLPSLLAQNEDVTLLRLGYAAVPMFLAFAPQIIPQSWGHHHTSKASAHRSFGRAFFVLSLASFVLHWKLFGSTLIANTPPQQVSVYDLFMNSIGRQEQKRPNRLLAGINNTAQSLKVVSKHPVISVTTSDVFFTTISLLVWTFTRDLDIEAMLDNSVLFFLAPRKTEKHVAFDAETKVVADDSLEPESTVPAITPKKRGRPRKTTLTNGASASTPSASASIGTLRRSTRRKARSDYESDAEETYDPPESAKRALAQTESDGATTAEDVVHGGEATALAMCLAIVGGLGQLAASVLGAEVTAVGE